MKHIGLLVKTALFLSVIYLWPSCIKKNDDPNSGNPYDTIPPNGWIVSTLAGSGERGMLGMIDDTGTKARFENPSAIAIDTNGNLYVTELNTPCIRKITPAGQVTTFVKEDLNAGYAIGAVWYLVTDGQGNFWGPDKKTRLIRKFTAAASTVFAGNSLQGHNDGQGTSASFINIMTIARDPKGNMYVPDYDSQNHFIIRMITPAGLVSTLTINDNTGISADAIGTVPATSYAMAADDKGNLYLVGGVSHTLIKKIDPQGNATIFVGSDSYGYKDGKGQEARCGAIGSLTIDSAGNLWICDEGNNTIRRASPDGTVTTIAGVGKLSGYLNGEAQKAMFNFPYGLEIDKQGAVYVLENGNRVIRKLVHN